MPITGVKRSVWMVGVMAALALSSCDADTPDASFAPEAVTTDAVDATEPAADPTGTAAAGATGETVAVKALDNTFIDEQVDVAVGTEVVWQNGGRNDHDIVPVVDGETWGVGIEAFHPGDSYSYVFTEPGTYRYFCTIHGTADVGMTGTITVE